MSLPIVSIIIPCFQQANFLPDALSSVQSQTFPYWECLVVDDGSTDATASVTKKWTDRDARCHYFRKENGGLSSARNFGLDRAQGRYIQFLDADDVILPTKLERQLHSLAGKTPHALSFCNYSRGSLHDIYQSQEGMKVLPPALGTTTSIYDLAADWETRITIPAHCFLFDRIFFDEGVRFDEKLPNHEDWDCWMHIFSRAKFIDYCPEKLALYRFSPSSMSRNLSRMKDGFIQSIDRHLLSDIHDASVKAILRVKRAEMMLGYELALRHQPASVQILVLLNRFRKKVLRKAS